MDWKKAINNIMELLWNINKWYFEEYKEELDTIWQEMIENEELRKENERLEIENQDYFEQYEAPMYNTD